MQFRTLSALFLAGCVSAGALGQVSQQGGGYLIRAKYKPGQVTKYSMQFTFNGKAMGPPSNMVMKVISVKKDIADISVTTSGLPGGGSKPNSATVELDSRNRPVKGQGIGTMSYPEKPVKVGESWGGEVTSAMGKANAKCVFKGMKPMNGHQVAQIAVNVSLGNGQGSGVGMMLVDAKDGQMLSLGLTVKVKMPNQGGKGGPPSKPIESVFSMKRV